MTDGFRPTVPRELDRLERFVGEWTSHDEHAPTPWAEQGGSGHSRHRFRRALDGYCFLSDFEGETPFGSIRGHAFWFYDRERARYGVRWYDSSANLLEGEGEFRADGALVVAYRYRMGGTDVDERHVFEPLDPGAYRLTIENVIDGAWRVASVQRYRRVAPGEGGTRGESNPARAALLLVGAKGSGKTYVGSLVGEKLGIQFLRVEPIFQENLRSSRLTGTALDAEGYAKVLLAVDDVLARERRVVLESTGASDAFPAFLDALRSRCGVKLVRIHASLERCRERVRTRDQTTHIAVSDERVSEINARAAAISLPWDVEIDNDGPASAESILHQIRAVL